MIDKFRIFSLCNRRVMTFAVALSLLAILLVQQSSAQQALNIWSSNGPDGQVVSLVVDPNNPNIVFGVTYNGVFKSVNYGASWSASNDGLDSSGVGGLAIDQRDPNTLYAGTNNGVFKTTNGGANWSRTNSPLVIVGRLAAAPSNSSIVYAVTEGNLLVTTDGGETWNERPSAEYTSYADVFVIDPQNPNIIYSGVTDERFSGLFKTTDGGSTWTRLNYRGGIFAPATFALKFDPANTNIIYAATYFGPFKSTDGGASWTQLGFGNSHALAIDPLNPRVLYAAYFYEGVYKSTDGGASWTLYTNGLPNLLILDLAIDRTGRFLHAATSAGVFSVRVREDRTVGGRVLTPDGRGLRNATVSITDAQGVVRTTTTSSFGFFSFDGVVAGAQYTISVGSRLYRYAAQTVQINDNLTLADFVGLE